jgi:hypothetical protein
MHNYRVRRKEALQCRPVQQVQFLEGETLLIPQPVEVPLFDWPGIERVEVIDADHLVAPSDERFREV